MSHESNQIISIWKDVEAQLSRHTLTYSGEKLQGKSLQTVLDAYSLWYLATYDSLLSVGIPPTLRIDWIHFVCSLDVRDLASSLKDADMLLLHNTSTSYDDFKHRLREEYPFIGRTLSPIKQIMEQWFASQSIPHFSIIHSWLNFIGRVNIDSKVLQSRALDDYLATEETLQSDGFTDEEALCITRWFPRSEGYRFSEWIRPKHGNGSTADCGKHMIDKYQSYARDSRLRYVDSELLPPRILADELKRSCRLVFVPKSLVSYRSISMEPSSLMWVQQGVLSAFVEYLHQHKYLRKRFLPETQQPNRDLAWLGSTDGSFATIDLTAASDSVSWALIKKWFGKTFLYRWMLCTRSTSVVLPGDGGTMTLKKFAPMGSALCFPSECIVFCAITECAIRECGADPKDSLYRVYGDDIVVETCFVEAVIRRLEINGFKVNLKKSFWTSSPDFTFRESCGGEYLNGEDVTPCRISRRFSGLLRHGSKASQISGLIELANDCYSRYPSVRRRIVSSLLTLPKNKRPLFDSSGERGIFSPNPTNWHLATPRWSDDYQRHYISHGTTVPNLENRTSEHDQVEDIRLFEYLRQSQSRPRLLYPEDRVDVDLRRQIAGKWTITSSPAEGILPSLEIT